MSERKPRGLFVNPKKAQCSIYESGRMMYECLRRSPRYDLEWREIDEADPAIPGGYDFYAFNYHHVTMGWLDLSSLARLGKAPRFTFVLEVNPGDPYVLCPKDRFDAYLPLDPSLVHPDPKVIPFPRPVEPAVTLTPYVEPEVPVIGSFGFGTPGKGFELVVEAVNREFERAKVRINIPPGTYADPFTQVIHARSYPEHLGELARAVAKPGVEVEITHRFMEDQELIAWCSQNTLNCFLYNRDQPGLSATTDQAIASRRPLAVGTNPTFRHIHPYLRPYPYRSLKEAIALSPPEVLRMGEDWAAERFAARFEEVLARFALLPAPSSTVALRTPPAVERRKVLVVNHPEKECGIHQYGEDITRALLRAERWEAFYAECSGEAELRRAVGAVKPAIVLYNHYPATMPWLTAKITRSLPGVQAGIMHEVTQEAADAADDALFDFHLCPDPTLIERNPVALRIPRLVPTYVNTQRLVPERLRIGSFGFPFEDKGFVRLVERVQQEFDEAEVRIHMPPNAIVAGVPDLAERCRAAATKPGIRVVTNEVFADRREVMDFLASNHMNVFLYDVHKRAGISSVVEKAIAAGRPVAVSKAGMFRHVHHLSPSICVEDRSLRDILASGYAPLVPCLLDWQEPAFVKGVEEVLDRMAARPAHRAAAPAASVTAVAAPPAAGLRTVRLGRGGPAAPPVAGEAPTVGVLNRVLDDRARAHYAPVVDELFRLAPAMMARKIPAANVQQAFVFDTVRRLLAAHRAPRVLCVGAFEDTASAGVKACGYAVEEIDPALNWDLDAFWRRPETRKASYDVVFSTSVIEHVEDDGLFVAQIADLLAPGGYAVLTCDFNDAYRPGDRVPQEDFRFYTSRDLGERLLARMPGCRLADVPAWRHGPPDFAYAGIPYMFASFVVRKDGGAAVAPLAAPQAKRLRVNRSSGYVMGPQR
ncbi:MAG: methyltransferase domain-containing protein [Anaeromyxobacteraceae bacterium]